MIERNYPCFATINRNVYNKQNIYYCMLSYKLSEMVLKAIENSPMGITNLEVLESLSLSGPFTLKTTLSRLNKSGRIIRLKRGVYSSNPMRDVYACAQALFNGYLGFSTALYLRGLISELPFTVTVVTASKSFTKTFAAYQFKAVALKEKAVGFENKGPYVVSTRAKSLFDCIYLPKYSIEQEKLVNAFKDASLLPSEWREFRHYVKKFAVGDISKRFLNVERAIKG
ncbi:TPA: hypothetical protein HA316_02420 [Candidatus Micrarchaeota archaeon]|nr:hypothetical protein [Candidatus Micrarchaeota archaeon]